MTKIGKKTSRVISSADRRRPPNTIFPRKNYHEDFIKGGPIGAIGQLPASITQNCHSVTIHYFGPGQRKETSDNVTCDVKYAGLLHFSVTM